MAWPAINPNTPAATDKVKFGDDKIREAKQNMIDALLAISNYSSGGTQAAIKTTVWTTSGRPTGANLVTGVTGYNSDLSCDEYYDGSNWKLKNAGLGSWDVSTRPSSPFIGQSGFNTDLYAIEGWNGSDWMRLAGGQRGDIKMVMDTYDDAEDNHPGWKLMNGQTFTHPEGGSVTLPDMRNRTPVCAGQDGGTYTPGVNDIGTGYYAPGAYGGRDKTTEVASHRHPSEQNGFLVSQSGGGYWIGNSGGSGASPVSISSSNTAYTGVSSVDLRTPYYAVCFMYKI